MTAVVTQGDDTVPMTIDHPRWYEFHERLIGPEGIDLARDLGGEKIAPTDTSKTVAILSDMGFGPDEIASSLAYFSARGGFNDYEICVSDGMTAGDEEAVRYTNHHEDHA